MTCVIGVGIDKYEPLVNAKVEVKDLTTTITFYIDNKEEFYDHYNKFISWGYKDSKYYDFSLTKPDFDRIFNKIPIQTNKLHIKLNVEYSSKEPSIFEVELLSDYRAHFFNFLTLAYKERFNNIN